MTKEKLEIYKRLKNGGVWATLGKIVFVASTLLWNALLTRILTEEEVGAFYLIASIATIGELIVLGGLNQVVLRLVSYSSADMNMVRPVIKGTMTLLFVFILICVPSYVYYVGPYLGYEIFNSPIVGRLVELTAAWFVLRALQAYFAFVLRGFHRISAAAYMDGATSSILTMFVLVVFWLGDYNANVDKIILIVIGALISTVILSLVLLKKNYQQTPVVAGMQIREPIRIGIPLSVLSFTVLGISEAHIWIVGAFAEHVDVAIYGAASRLNKFVAMPLIIVNGIISSSISQLHASNAKKSIEKLLQTFSLITAFVTVLLTLFIFIFPAEILGLVFGESYASGWSVLVVLMMGQTVAVLVGSPGTLMAMTDHQNASMVIGVLSGLVGVAVSLVLVNVYGALGVAIGVSVGRILHNVSMWLYCLFRLEIKTHASFAAIKYIKKII